MSFKVDLLDDRHVSDEFNSGAPELDGWIKTQGSVAQQRDLGRIYVIADTSSRVLAYSALVVATVESRSLGSRAGRGLPAAVPAVLLAKLAVDQSAQNAGHGKALLGHAARTALQVRDLVGARLLVTEARDDSARDWYVKYGMKALKDGRTCFVRLSDLAP